MKPKVKEISATGGGAAPGTGATANPGEGEGMATMYGFGGAGGTKAKRKKGLMVKKTLETKIKEAISNFCKEDIEEAENPYLNPNTKKGRPRDKYGKSEKDLPFDAKRDSRFKDDDTSTSSFEEGKVHKIEFLSTPIGANHQSKRKNVIYRKITKNEYDKLKSNYKISATITPSNEVKHYEDVYYVILPEKVYSKRELGSTSEVYKYYTSLKLSQVNSLPSDIKSAIKFRYIPVTDLANNGLSIRYIDPEGLKDLMFKKEKERYIDMKGTKRYMILKGPGDGRTTVVKMTDPEVAKWQAKYGDDSLDPIDNKTKGEFTKVKTTYAPGTKKKDKLDPTLVNTKLDRIDPKVLASVVITKNPKLANLSGTSLDTKAEDLAIKTMSKLGISKVNIDKLIKEPDFGMEYIRSIHDKVKNIQLAEAKPVLQPLPSGDDPLSKAQKAVKLLLNRFFGMTFDEATMNLAPLDKLETDSENIRKWISKEEDKYFESDEDLATELANLGGTVVALQNVLDDLNKGFEAAHYNKDIINYNK